MMRLMAAYHAGFRFPAHIDGDIAAHRAMRANRGGRLHFPRAGAKAKISRGQRTHRANIGGIAGEYRVKAGF